ncbi:FAD-dependent monooxygenase [Oceanicella sp. SM1341]|uniref:FAD-dependent monooxygenase n=1 Tax=Oceanicella sp. SM1341 TaxID=1548889 RepID=UPI000E4A08B0|nr:FAD-dependent monooxygenase [Oceanicella sp. SM1341]
MRPAGRGERDSLYFTYPTFEAPSGAARAGLTGRAPVVIVGAGPVGMLAALELARHGIASVLLEARDTFNDGSRAICVARQSFRILESVGAVAPFLDKALGWTTGRSFYRGRQVLEFAMPDSADEKYRPMYNIQQQFIEQYLWEAISRSPLIEMRWCSRVTGIADITGGLRLTVEDTQEGYAMEADWVIAADGARSPVRSLRGLRLAGQNFEGRYVIADVQMRHDYPTIRRALFDPDCRRGGTVLVHRQPDDIWRIDYQLAEGESEAEALREERVRASVAALLAELGHEGPWELEWWSVYSANTLALEDYRDGRVFFAGDSAHIVPIFGVRGLNNGLADAQNIGWKLARVLQGRAGAALLDSYSPERRGATLDVFANATRSARFMTPPGPGWALMRDAALNLALSHPFAGELANPRQMTPYTYADSPVVLPDDPGFDGGPVPGAVLPDAALEGGFLSERLGPGFTLVTCAPALAEAMAGEVEAVLIPPGSGAALLLRAGPRSAYLVRPDGHIAARVHDATAEDIRTALALSGCARQGEPA